MRIAKVYLLKWHDEGQLPYAPLVRLQPHADAAVRACERWLAQHFREPGAVARAVDHSRVPERTLKRRFKAATGLTLIDYLQGLRIEEAKRLLEAGERPAEDVSAEVGYEGTRRSSGGCSGGPRDLHPASTGGCSARCRHRAMRRAESSRGAARRPGRRPALLGRYGL